MAAYLGTSAEEAEEEMATHHRPELHMIDTSAGGSGAPADPATGAPGGPQA